MAGLTVGVMTVPQVQPSVFAGIDCFDNTVGAVPTIDTCIRGNTHSVQNVTWLTRRACLTHVLRDCPRNLACMAPLHRCCATRSSAAAHSWCASLPQIQSCQLVLSFCRWIFLSFQGVHLYVGNSASDPECATAAWADD